MQVPSSSINGLAIKHLKNRRLFMNKTVPSVEEAVADIKSGSIIALGGFFTGGNPSYLTTALTKIKVKDLTMVAMCAGAGNKEIDELLRNGQVKKLITNYPFFRSATKGKSHIVEQMARAGKVDVQVYPMGTFAEKLRAGGAGIPAFYTPTGVGTALAEGKETRSFDDRDYLLELAIKPDYAFVHALKGDTEGNLVYCKTSRNYNPVMAMAAKITIVEVENLVEPGELDADYIHTPGIYVRRIVKVDRPNITPGID
jgi:3-oxoacid CoA-transferase subunit A